MPNRTLQTYKKIYQDYASKNSMNDGIKHTLDSFISLLSGKKILDIGCAHGRESKYLYENGFNVTGIDFNPGFIDLAKHNCPNCVFEIMDMRELNFSKDSFDGIWASTSFLHIPKNEALKTLKGFRNVLKEGGVMYLSVFEGNFDNEKEDRDKTWGFRHFSDYTQDELTTLLGKAGFDIINIEKTVRPSGRAIINTFSK